VGCTASTAPVSRANGASGAGVASTIRCSGRPRRSARNAGTVTSRSPNPSARNTNATGGMIGTPAITPGRAG
jgi:hypothetical protein